MLMTLVCSRATLCRGLIFLSGLSRLGIGVEKGRLRFVWGGDFL